MENSNISEARGKEKDLQSLSNPDEELKGGSNVDIKNRDQQNITPNNTGDIPIEKIKNTNAPSSDLITNTGDDTSNDQGDADAASG